MRSCRTTDERLFAFVDGLDSGLDDHVAGCDECQQFLAELWSGELAGDLSEPVMRTIRFDEFLASAARLGIDIAVAMARALVEYGPQSDIGEAGE